VVDEEGEERKDVSLEHVENSALRTLPLYFSFRLSYLSSLSQARILERNLYVNYSVYVGMITMIGL
jgi:hypothetical protein